WVLRRVTEKRLVMTEKVEQAIEEPPLLVDRDAGFGLVVVTKPRLEIANAHGFRSRCGPRQVEHRVVAHYPLRGEGALVKVELERRRRLSEPAPGGGVAVDDGRMFDAQQVSRGAIRERLDEWLGVPERIAEHLSDELP